LDPISIVLQYAVEVADFVSSPNSFATILSFDFTVESERSLLLVLNLVMDETWKQE